MKSDQYVRGQVRKNYVSLSAVIFGEIAADHFRFHSVAFEICFRRFSRLRIDVYKRAVTRSERKRGYTEYAASATHVERRFTCRIRFSEKFKAHSGGLVQTRSERPPCSI